MVVIKTDLRTFREKYGTSAYDDVISYSDVIGYSVEVDDASLRIEFNPDRPDLMSFATLMDSIRRFEAGVEMSLRFTEVDREIFVDERVLAIRPFVSGFIALGEPISDSLNDLIEYQERLHLIVGKRRKKSSIGIHDLDRISFPLRYVASPRSEIEFETYDGSVTGTADKIIRTHPKGIEFGSLLPEGELVPIILDSAGDVMSMPPIINGSKSAICNNTKNFFVDITGTDRHTTEKTAYLMARYFDSLGFDLRVPRIYGRKKRPVVVPGNKLRTISILKKDVKGYLGKEIPNDDVKKTFNKMGYTVANGTFPFTVGIPQFRVDVMGPADVIEDLAKGLRYDKIEALPPRFSTIASRDQKKEFMNVLRFVLVGAGLQEVSSFVLVSRNIYTYLSYKGGIEIINPKSDDFSVVRDRLSISLLSQHANNADRAYPQNIFEIGDVIADGNQKTHLAISLAHSKATFSEIKRYVNYIFERLFAVEPEVEAVDDELMIPGRSALITLKGQKLGLLGEVHPRFLEQFSLKIPVALAEVDVGSLYMLYSSA